MFELKINKERNTLVKDATTFKSFSFMVQVKDLEDNDFEAENHPNLKIVLARVENV